tara:strand:+ start:186 stop:374 length:189 start_codon:yes stop_codon:yes gene_type:complete
MKIGDIVRCSLDREDDYSKLGLIVDIVNSTPEVCPPVCRVLWSNGRLEKDWFDELEVIGEAR